MFYGLLKQAQLWHINSFSISAPYEGAVAGELLKNSITPDSGYLQVL